MRKSGLYFLHWCPDFGLCESYVFELVHFFQHFPIHPYVWWSWLDSVDNKFPSVAAGFHAESSIRFLQSFNELLEFFFTASKQIDVVSKPQVAKWPSYDWRWCAKVFCIYIIFSMNILSCSGYNVHPWALTLSFERNLQRFRLWVCKFSPRSHDKSIS